MTQPAKPLSPEELKIQEANASHPMFDENNPETWMVLPKPKAVTYRGISLE